MSRRSRFAYVLAALVLVATAAAASPALAQSLEVKSGSPLSIDSLTIRADVEEGVALVDVDQTFRNATDRQREGVYTFRLPAEASVHSLSMWMAGKEKQGRVLESQLARRVYDSIVNRHRDPALLEQIGWRTFRVSVFPIPPRDTVRIRLRYTHVVSDELGLQTLEIPLPERAGAVGLTDIQVNVGAARGLSVLDCPSHQHTTITNGAGGGSVRWSDEGAVLTGPFTVRAKPPGEGFDLALLAHKPPGAEDGYFLVRILPKLERPPRVPRDVVFVVDRSGSMRGKKIAQARDALLHGLSTLTPKDRFSVLSFSTDVAELGGGDLLPVNDETLTEARNSANALEASGGTNIDAALQNALELRSEDRDRLFLIVFLTDGEASVGVVDNAQILARYKDRSDGGVRLFAFGVGDDVKDFLLTRLAAESRGAAAYVRENEDLEIKLSSLFEKVRSPLLVSPEITVDGVEIESVEPRPLPDVFRGSAVVLAGRYRGGGAATLTLRGRIGPDNVNLSIPAAFPKQPVSRPHVAQLWARMRIDRLLDDLRTHGMVAEIKQEIVDLGVDYQVVSPYTSFLVVEDGVVIPDARGTARVPEGPPPATAGADTGGPNTGGPGGPTTGGGGAGRPGSGWSGGSHGGSFRGPIGEVPPDSREPSDPPPAPAGGGPTTPGGETGGPTTGGGGPTTPGGETGGPTTGGGDSGAGLHAFGKRRDGRTRGPGFEAWNHWWAFTSRDIVEEMALARPGLGGPVVRSTVFAALRDVAAEDGENFAIRSQAALALARAGDRSPATWELIRRMLDRDPPAGASAFHKVVDERAALSYALRGGTDAESRDRLLRVLEDPGRNASFARPFAAISLGLLGRSADADGRVTSALLGVLARAEPKRSVKPAALISLGLLGDPAVVPELLHVLEHRRVSAPGAVALSDVDLVYAVEALGRIASPGAPDAAGRSSVVMALRAVVVAPKGPSMLRRSAVRSLGHIGPACKPAGQRLAVNTLVDAVQSSKDASTRNFSLVSLGRVAGAAATTKYVRERALAWLRRWADQDRPFAVLALAVAKRGGAVEPAVQERLVARLRKRLASAGSMDATAAAALALGIAGDRESVEALAARTLDAGEAPIVRESALIALGLIGDPRGRAAVRAVLKNTDSALQESAIRSAGLLRDDTTADHMLQVLEQMDGPSVRAAAWALPLVADESTVRRLAEIVADEKRQFPDLGRSLAAVALGRMAWNGGPDPIARALRDYRYRAHVPALAELFSLD